MRMKWIIRWLLVVLLGRFAVAQELPDAPQPQTSTCSQYLFDENGALISVPVDCASIPAWRDLAATNAPAPRPAGFFAFRKSYKDPPLRTNREVFTSKVILVTHIAGFAAMMVACSRKNSHEHWHSEMPAMIAVSGMDYVGDRYFTRLFGVAPMIYATVHYSLAAAN